MIIIIHVNFGVIFIDKIQFEIIKVLLNKYDFYLAVGMKEFSNLVIQLSNDTVYNITNDFESQKV